MSDESPEAASIFDNPEPPAPGAMTGDSPFAPPEVTVDVGEYDPHDHTAEVDAVDAAAAADGTKPPTMPEHVELPLANGALIPGVTDALHDEIERRFTREHGDLQVVVTQSDRDAFVRAAMNDSELIFPIELPGVNATVNVAMPPDVFTSSAAAAATDWGDKLEFITKGNDMQWLLSFQQMHVWFQVRAINGVATPWSDTFADGIPKARKLRKKLSEPKNFDAIFDMSAVRWRMLLDATRIAEYKYKICLENWREKTFFTGADTD